MPRLIERLGLTRYEADEYYKLALQAYEKHQLEEAILKMEEAIKILSTEPEYYAARGLFYLEDGIKDKALADFEQALKLNPYEMLAHYGCGMIAYKDGNYDEAEAHFRDAFIADQKRPETLYYLALVYHRKRDNQRALAVMQQAVALLGEKDKRRADANRWVREFQRLIEQQERYEKERAQQQAALPTSQSALPFTSGEEQKT